MKYLYIYIAKKFISTFIFSIISLSLIFIVVDLFEHLDDFLDRNASLLIIGKYYIFYIPSILKILFPIATLLATLFSIGNLSNTNEITAMKSGGLSLYKLFIPLMILTLFITVIQLAFATHLSPMTNKYKTELEKSALGKSNDKVYLSQIYLRDNPHRIVLIRDYNAQLHNGYNMQIFDFNQDLTNPRIAKSASAITFKWDSTNKSWQLNSVIQRLIQARKIKETRINDTNITFTFSNNDLARMSTKIEEMNINELYKFLEFRQKGGEDIQKELTEFYGIIAFPFANIVVLLFGIPFASIKKRGGMAVQIGAALVVSFTYLIFTKIGQTIGFAVGMHPLLSAWIANIAFLIIGLIVLFKTPK
jgi:lipopolysaccharide export system permease protein